VKILRRVLLLLGLIALCGCMPGRQDIRRALDLAQREQETALTCEREDRCAIASPLRELADPWLDAPPEATIDLPHRVLLLESGQDALLARVALIRSAQRSIDIQSFIFAEDDAGYFILNELLEAARRGVQVRVLLDQLFSVDDVRLLAGLAQAHVNFDLRLYNPTFGEANTGPVQFVAGILCCFSRFNQRMHNKLLLIDERVGITGGRNYQNRYFDWDPEYNYRDRDVLAAGPVARQMHASFEAFWRHRRSVPVAALRDVRRWIGRHRDEAVPLAPPRLSRADRILELSAQAGNRVLIERRLMARVREVGRVDYVSDLPNKPFERNSAAERDLTASLQGLLRRADHRIVLQTPYLVLSSSAQRLFRELQARPQPPAITVSTNSLAATDAFPVYALSHKYKRRYLRDFGFRIFELKPFPADVPIDPEIAETFDDKPLATPESFSESRRFPGSGSGRGSSRQLRGPLPLGRAGPRVGLHAKSLVIDDEIGMVGTHNFDPRSDKFNTESALIVHDAGFARELAEYIHKDAAPENAWTIARRPKSVVLSGVTYSVGKVFEALPLFDLWPVRYATSYEIKPGCEPLPATDPRFHECYEPVGDFPEVDVPLKSIYTRILTAFGAGLAPIL
jgi:phosphatidylserine/phosphatidylglycerophosphate/cardiolipin synthase-like enzyme